MSVPKSVWQGSFHIGGIELICHVLDDGTRIIDKESLEHFFASLESNEFDADGDLEAFAIWQRGINPSVSR